jgi:hypothetical protein
VTATWTDTGRRVERLLRWYPESWRARYGDEFAALLTAELAERPQSWRRTANVVWSGVIARTTVSGLSGHALEPTDQVRTGLASLGCALAVFAAFGVAMWSQLTIGWQWARPEATGTAAAMVLMSGAMLLFLVLGVLAAVPVTWHLLGRMARREARGLLRPSLLALGGASLVIVGARHFGNGWPGTGGHPWAHQGLVPGGVAAFLWASTLWISSYWAHPGALLAFPLAEVAWMVASPLAMGCIVVGATKILRRLDVSPRVLRYERRLGRVAAGVTALFLIGSCCWIVDGGPGPGNLFHAGAIDVAGLATMALASLVAHRAMRQAGRGGLTDS